MGIGRTFTEAFLKAMRSRELDGGRLGADANLHPWFQAELERARGRSARLRSLDELVADDWLRLKRAGWSDADDRRSLRHERGARAARGGARGASGRVYRRVDSCAGEVEARSNYLYSTWGEADEAAAGGRDSRGSSSSARARTGSARGSSSTTAASTRRRASARSATRP